MPACHKSSQKHRCLLRWQLKVADKSIECNQRTTISRNCVRNLFHVRVCACVCSDYYSIYNLSAFFRILRKKENPVICTQTNEYENAFKCSTCMSEYMYEYAFFIILIFHNDGGVVTWNLGLIRPFFHAIDNASPKCKCGVAKCASAFATMCCCILYGAQICLLNKAFGVRAQMNCVLSWKSRHE